MRQVSIIKILISLSILISVVLPSMSAIKGGIQYAIPVDYSKVDEKVLSKKAEEYFVNVKPTMNGIIDENMTNAVFLYSVLEKTNPANIDYSVKLGILYGMLDKDRQAKGYFSKAMGIDKSNPSPYFYFGEFYYNRALYRRALNNYNEAYKRGYEKHQELLSRMADIYEKFGDTRSALKYYREAYEIDPTEELGEKINRVECSENQNREYYVETRIRG